MNLCESCKKFEGCGWAKGTVRVCSSQDPITRADLAAKDSRIAELEKASAPVWTPTNEEIRGASDMIAFDLIKYGNGRLVNKPDQPRGEE